MKSVCCTALSLALFFPAPNSLAGPDEQEVGTLEIAPGLTVPLAQPKPIDWETVSPERLVKLFLAQLRSDPSDELQYRQSVVRILLEEGEVELADEIMEEVRQDDRAEILAEAGARLAQAGKADLGRERLARAKEWLGYAKGEHRNSALRWLALGHVALEEKVEAEKLIPQIRNEFDSLAAKGAMLSRWGKMEDVAAFMEKRGERYVLPQVDMLIEEGRRSLIEGNVEEADATFRKAGERAFGLKKINGITKVVRIVELLLEHGATKEASWHLGAYLKGVQILADEMPEKAVMLAEASMMARKLGRMEFATQLLEAGEGTIKKVFVLYAARPLCALARERTSRGDSQRAAQLIDIAARSSAGYDHIRGRAMGAVWVCLYYHLTGLSMESEVREQMKKAAGA